MIMHIFDRLQQNVTIEWFFQFIFQLLISYSLFDELLIDTNTYRNGTVNKFVMQL